MTMALGAPLLAGGPPGWALYGLLGLGTLAAVGIVAMSSANNKADTYTDTTTDAGVCQGCKRKCSEQRHDELKKQLKKMQESVFTNQAFKSGNVRKLAKVPCDEIRQRLSDMKALRDKRQQIQDECYPDSPEPGHEDAMKQLDNGIKNLEALEKQNCGSS